MAHFSKPSSSIRVLGRKIHVIGFLLVVTVVCVAVLTPTMFPRVVISTPKHKKRLYRKLMTTNMPMKVSSHASLKSSALDTLTSVKNDNAGVSSIISPNNTSKSFNELATLSLLNASVSFTNNTSTSSSKLTNLSQLLSHEVSPKSSPQVSRLTSASKSFWSIVTKDIFVNRPFHIMMTACDQSGNRMNQGDDFLRPILSSEVRTSQQKVTILGEVKDFANGSYLITFLPSWTGPAYIYIQLWMTSRTVSMIESKILHSNYVFLCALGHNYGYDVLYAGPQARVDILKNVKTAGKRKDGELSLCRMDWQPSLVDFSSKSCNMSFPPNYHWYGTCEGERTGDSTMCRPHHWCVFHQQMAATNSREVAANKQGIGIVSGDVQSVIIRGDDKNSVETNRLEPCKPQPLVVSRGYWRDKEWVNRDCLFACNSKEKWWKYLEGKNLYLIGDSTVRQLFSVLMASAGIQVPTNGAFVPPKYKDYSITKYKATIHYRLHGLPLLSSLALNFGKATYTADTIDDIPGNENEVLILSCVHHLVLLPPNGFRDRLQQILAAIGRLRQKSLGKNIPIIFRTANPRNFDSARINSYRIRWYNKIAIDTFTASNLGIVVYDIFDMFAATNFIELVHLPGGMIELELSQMFSLLCPTC
ncbi:NXPE family member 4-like [Corticium candelabrum]|uniref:NXPE family member 4-like n=1 Tax=Corticium candelabrum TaxID=121492 RepID=UPI002E25A096|nr:NXPE family member 4-like [Corticium candelabrum]